MQLKEQTIKLYDVNMYIDKDGSGLNKPSFDLKVTHVRNINAVNQAVDVKYNITFSKLSTQAEYDRFKQRLFDILNSYSTTLGENCSDILFVCLDTYWQLVETTFDQDYYMNSENGLRNAKPLAELFAFVSNRKLDDMTSSATFNLGGIEFKFLESDLVNFMVNAIKQQIKENDFPYSLGANMIELRDALVSGSNEGLSEIANRNFSQDVIRDSKFLTTFCIMLHRVVCAILDVDSTRISGEQSMLYVTIANRFDIDGCERYILAKGDARSRKHRVDSLQRLLSRALMRHRNLNIA